LPWSSCQSGCPGRHHGPGGEDETLAQQTDRLAVTSLVNHAERRRRPGDDNHRRSQRLNAPAQPAVRAWRVVCLSCHSRKPSPRISENCGPLWPSPRARQRLAVLHAPKPASKRPRPQRPASLAYVADSRQYPALMKSRCSGLSPRLPLTERDSDRTQPVKAVRRCDAHAACMCRCSSRRPRLLSVIVLAEAADFPFVALYGLRLQVCRCDAGQGRDTYGPQKTMLFLSALDRGALAPLTPVPRRRPASGEGTASACRGANSSGEPPTGREFPETALRAQRLFRPGQIRRGRRR